MKNSFSIRRCALPDLDAIMELQQHISDTMTNPDLFVATDRADNRDYLISPNAIFGVYDETRMGAIRFALEPGGEFQSPDRRLAAPHRLRLPHFSKRRP